MGEIRYNKKIIYMFIYVKITNVIQNTKLFLILNVKAQKWNT